MGPQTYEPAPIAFQGLGACLEVFVATGAQAQAEAEALRDCDLSGPTAGGAGTSGLAGGFVCR